MKLFAFNIKIKALDEFSDNFANVGKKMDRLGRKASQLGKNLSVGLSLPLAAFGALAVKRAADFETLRTALETATGSTQAAAEEFERLQQFAATTPFQLEEVVQSFIKLKNLGLDPSQEALTSYGNTAGAMGKSLDQMIEAVADASTGEFERLKEFGIKSKSEGNKVTFTFRGVKTTVRKEAAEITEYLKSLGNIQFAGGMDKQAATIAGAFSNMQDSISGALDLVGTDIAKTLNLNERVRAFSEVINGLAQGFTKLPKPVKDFAVWAGIAVIALGPLISAVGQLIIGMGVMVALAPQIAVGFAAITAAAPWLLLVGAFAALGFYFNALIEDAGGLENAIKVLGGVVLDSLLAPLRWVADKISAIWSMFESPPAFLTSFASSDYSYGQNAANSSVGLMSEEGQRAREVIQNSRANYDLQQRAMKGDKAAIEILFKNPPPGMRTNVTTETNANVSVEQGVAMEGAY